MQFIILGFASFFCSVESCHFRQGFVFFTLNLIIGPLHDPTFTQYLINPQNPLLAILVGCLFTAAVQSSSVTTGLAIVFTQQGLLSLENAVPIIIGANIGIARDGTHGFCCRKTALSFFL